MKIEIKSWFNGSILFEGDFSCLSKAVEQAVKDRARLDGARLDGARLDGASLDGARLDGASLDRASLDRASLDRASLDGARLDGASLHGARLVGASLDRASLDGASLVGASLENGEKITKCERPILQIGPIGSSGRYLVSYITYKGIRLRTGCFFGSVEEFTSELKETHKKNQHAQEYLAALAMIEAHYKIWK